jgi:hypothetical protein
MNRLALFILIWDRPRCRTLSPTSKEKILRWDTEAYGRHGNVTRNAAVYYVRVANVVYQVTRGTTQSEANLASGQRVQCRIEKDHMFTPENGKEVKFAVIGSAEAP